MSPNSEKPLISNLVHNLGNIQSAKTSIDLSQFKYLDENLKLRGIKLMNDFVSLYSNKNIRFFILTKTFLNRQDSLINDIKTQSKGFNARFLLQKNWDISLKVEDLNYGVDRKYLDRDAISMFMEIFEKLDMLTANIKRCFILENKAIEQSEADSIRTLQTLRLIERDIANAQTELYQNVIAICLRAEEDNNIQLIQSISNFLKLASSQPLFKKTGALDYLENLVTEIYKRVKIV